MGIVLVFVLLVDSHGRALALLSIACFLLASGTKPLGVDTVPADATCGSAAMLPAGMLAPA